MIKRIVVYLLVAASLGAIAYVYLSHRLKTVSYGDAWALVPTGAAMITEARLDSSFDTWLPALHQLATNRSNALTVQPNPLASLPGILLRLDSLATTQAGWHQALLANSILFISMSKTTTDSWLLVIPVEEKLNSAQALGMLESFEPVKSKRSFSGTTLYSGIEIKMALTGSCILLGTEESLLEEAVLRASGRGAHPDDAVIRRCTGVKGSDTPFHFYAPMLNESNDWIELDPVLNPDIMGFSGYFIPGSDTSPLRLIDEKKQLQIPPFASQCDYINMWSYADAETGWRKLEEIYAHTQAATFWSVAWKDLGDSCQCDLNEAMLAWRTGTWGSASFVTSDSTTAEVLFFEVADSLDATKSLQPLLELSSNGLYRVKFPQIFERNALPTFPVQVNWVAQCGSWLLAGEDAVELEHVRSICTAGATIAQSTESAQWLRQRTFFHVPFPRVLLPLFGSNTITTSIFKFRDNKWRIDVMIGEDGKWREPVLESEPSTAADDGTKTANQWQLQNHIDGSKEILMQDAEHNLILTDAAGHEVFRRVLDAMVVGTVQQIDALKNGKLQMTFAAGDKVYVIDRTSRDLPGFPVTLPARATSPLAVFDYAGDKTYRLVVACADGSVANLNVQGKTTEGWRYEAKSDRVVSQIVWKRLPNEDVLFALDINLKVHALKRNGVYLGLLPEKFSGNGKLEIDAGADWQSCKIWNR